jgi:ubiquinone biosynthesis monooxygenase Coq7
LCHIDRGLKTLTGDHLGKRPSPARNKVNGPLTRREQRRSASLLRVDHSGEVCAQGLYQGQALTAAHDRVRRDMQQSGDEENDHLDWCWQRLRALDSHASYLNPAWYMGSLIIGMIAGAAGDRWSLGFVMETERQVMAHLDRHITKLPINDRQSRAVIAQMSEDEYHHATMASEHGGYELPTAIRLAMRLSSKVMTLTAYWV